MTKFEKELNNYLNKCKKSVKESKCPFCQKEVSPCEFRDQLSAKEFQISGLCQTCQDKTFGS